MPSLESLSDYIITEIIGYALDLPPPTLKPVREDEDEDEQPCPKQVCRVMNVSHRFRHLTSQVYFARKIYTAHCKRKLFWMLLHHSRTDLIRNVRIVLFSGCTNFDIPQNIHPPEMAHFSVAPMKLLSPQLKRLYLKAPGMSYPYYTTKNATHASLLYHLHRFKNLEELYLDFHREWLRFDLFSSMSHHLPNPMFPHLTKLTVRGCFSKCNADQVTYAFAQQQLPSLKSLTIDGVSYDATVEYGGEHAFWWELFTARALVRMNRLEEFAWIHRSIEADVPDRFSTQFPHNPPSNSHLQALKESHGMTLRRVTLDYGSFPVRSIGVTKDDLMGFVKDMPDLERVRIRALTVGVDIGGGIREQ